MQDANDSIRRVFQVPCQVFGQDFPEESLADDLVVAGFARDHKGRIDRLALARIYEMFGGISSK